MNLKPKNKQIALTKHATMLCHKSMTAKTFEVKIQENKLSKSQKEALETVFLEAKWYRTSSLIRPIRMKRTRFGTLT